MSYALNMGDVKDKRELVAANPSTYLVTKSANFSTFFSLFYLQKWTWAHIVVQR